MADATSVWSARAERLLEQALSETRDGIDSIPTVDAALTALRIEAGEVPADAMDGYHFPGEDDSDDGCTCPPALVARGGWSSRCPVHGGGLRA